MILTFGTHNPDEYLEGTQTHLIDFLEKHKKLPDLIVVKDEDAFDLFESIAEQLGIKIALIDRLPAVEEACKAFHEFFS
jgi:hypothetical protein